MLSRQNSALIRAVLLFICWGFLLQGAWAAFSGSGFLAEGSSRKFVLASSSVKHPSFATLSISSADPANGDDHRFYYISHLARWATADPIGKKFQAGNINLYRYVGNGVTGGVDL